jgi:Zn-dependent metalloprotease
MGVGHEMVGKRVMKTAESDKSMKSANGISISKVNSVKGISYWEKIPVDLDVVKNGSEFEMRYIENNKVLIETRQRKSDGAVGLLTRDTDVVRGTMQDGVVFDYNRNCPKAAVDCYRYSIEVFHYFKNHHDFDLCQHVGGKMVIVSDDLLGGLRAQLRPCKCSRYSRSSCDCGYSTLDYVLVEEIDDSPKATGSYERIWCSLEAIAHEWTHSLFWNKKGNKKKQRLDGDGPETGALREAICDAFGAFISDRWKLGEICMEGTSIRCARNMEDPNNGSIFNKNEPDRMHQIKCGPDNYDDFVSECSPHQDYLNCCIINKATHLMAKGGRWKGIDYHGMGGEALANLYFYILTNPSYLGEEGTFERFKEYLCRAVDDLYGEKPINLMNKNQYQEHLADMKIVINNAFAAVGIGHTIFPIPDTPIIIPGGDNH